MTSRPMSRATISKLVGIALALFMIAAVACTSGESTGENAASGGDTSAADGNSGAASNQDSSGNLDSSGSVANTDPSGSEPVVPGISPAEQVEQATGALFLEMLSPDTDELFVTQGSFEFSGRTTVDALLSVNDHVVEIDEHGNFSLDMALEEGPNVVEVIASNALGEQFDEVLLVIYEPV